MTKIKQFPHCDCTVLHSPSSGCRYCNAHPDWQELREAWKINFTGDNDPKKSPCPSEVGRTVDDIHRWPGNRPATPEEERLREEYFKELDRVLRDHLNTSD